MRRIAFASLALLAASIPIENIHQFPVIGTPARLLGLLAVALTALEVVAARRMRPLAPHVLWAYLFVLWVTASLFWSVDPTSTPERIETFLQLFAMLLIIHELCTTQWHVDVLLQAFVVGCLAAALTVGQSFVLGIEAYYGRFAVPGADPNDTAVQLAVALPVAWYLADRVRSPWWRAVDLIYLVAGTGAIALTGSRAGFMSLLLAFVAIAVLATRGGRGGRVRLAVIAVVAAALVVTVVPDFIFERIALVGEEVESGDLNGRVQLWRESIAAFSDSPLLGTGAGATKEVLPTGKVAHNLVLSVVVEFGLIGLVLFTGMVVSVVPGIGRLEASTRTALVAVGAILAFGSLSLSLESRKLLWLLLAITAAATTLARGRGDPPPTADVRAPDGVLAGSVSDA